MKSGGSAKSTAWRRRKAHCSRSWLWRASRRTSAAPLSLRRPSPVRYMFVCACLSFDNVHVAFLFACVVRKKESNVFLKHACGRCFSVLAQMRMCECKFMYTGMCVRVLMRACACVFECSCECTCACAFGRKLFWQMILHRWPRRCARCSPPFPPARSPWPISVSTRHTYVVTCACTLTSLRNHLSPHIPQACKHTSTHKHTHTHASAHAHEHAHLRKHFKLDSTSNTMTLNTLCFLSSFTCKKQTS